MALRNQFGGVMELETCKLGLHDWQLAWSLLLNDFNPELRFCQQCGWQQFWDAVNAKWEDVRVVAVLHMGPD